MMPGAEIDDAGCRRHRVGMLHLVAEGLHAAHQRITVLAEHGQHIVKADLRLREFFRRQVGVRPGHGQRERLRKCGAAFAVQRDDLRQIDDAARRAGNGAARFPEQHIGPARIVRAQRGQVLGLSGTSASRQPELHQRRTLVLLRQAVNIHGLDQLRRLAVDGEGDVGCDDVLAEQGIERAPCGVVLLDWLAGRVVSRRAGRDRIRLVSPVISSSCGEQWRRARAALSERRSDSAGSSVASRRASRRNAELFLANRNQQRCIESALRHLVLLVDRQRFLETVVAAGAEQRVGLGHLGNHLRRRSLRSAADRQNNHQNRE